MNERSLDPSDIPQEVIDAVRTIEQWHHHHGVEHWALFGICSRNNEVDRNKLKTLSRIWFSESCQYHQLAELARSKGVENHWALSRAATLNGCVYALEKALE